MTAHNPFKDRQASRAGGPTNLAQVVPDDTQDLPVVSQWLYVGNAGALTVTTVGGQTVTFPTIHAGWHLLELSRIHATSTTASDMVVGW